MTTAGLGLRVVTVLLGRSRGLFLGSLKGSLKGSIGFGGLGFRDLGFRV